MLGLLERAVGFFWYLFAPVQVSAVSRMTASKGARTPASIYIKIYR